MATQLEDLNSMPLQMLREMRRNPGAYSRALIARTLQEREAAEQPIPRVISIDRGARPTPVEMNFAQYRKPTDRAPTDVEERPAGETPSRFRQDYQRGLSAVAPVLNEKFGSNARDAMARRDALNKLRLSLPNDGIFEYFNRQTPDRIAAPLIRSFIDQNSDVLVNDPDAYQAFVSDPAGFVQMQNRVLTPREQGDRIAPTVEAMAGPPMQMAGAEPDAGPESVPAPFLPPLMAGAGGMPPGFNGTMAQGDADVPPWLRPRAPAGGAVGEGGSTAGGRPVTPMAPVPPQNPAMAAITAGQQAATETAAPAVAAAGAGAEAAGLAEAEGAMSPALKQATDDYMKLINAEGDTDERDRYLALAKAGFAMASSGSPYLLQAVGQGGNAGIDAYQAARAKAAERRLRGAQGTLEVAKIGEDVRRNNLVDKRENRRLTEAERAAQKAEEDRAEARRLQGEGLAIQRVGQEAQAQYYSRPDMRPLGQDEKGNAIMYDAHSQTFVTGPKVASLGNRAGADAEKALEVRQRIVEQMYPNLSREERADIVFGRSNPSASELRVKAREMAAKELGDRFDWRPADKEPYDKAVARKTEEIMGYLRGSGGAAPAAPAPAAAAPPPGATIRYDRQGNRLP